MPGKPYYITTAIAYPNGVPHIGHAYEAIATDAIARFMRLDGRDVFFLTGTDEHGIKMLQTAAKENVTPRELVERNVPRFQAMVKRFNCSNDDFIRTTEPRHYRSSEAIWQRMQAAGDIYLDKYAGWYSVRDEAYYDESETRLDDKGVRLGPQGTPVEWVEEESYFFKLSAFADRLLELYKRVPDFVLPRERMNEVASFVRGGLKDLSLSRTTFDWGIKVPENPKHIMYVWVDALTNYITAVGYPDTDSAMFKKYWPADLHVIGKDIVRFHAVYWPAFLMSAGVAVPRRIFSHGFLFNRGEKMSKSVGNVIDPFALADAYGVDPLRYFLLREVPFGQDGNYSHEAIVNRINADLANDLGNLAQRSLTMVGRNFGGVLPAPGAYSANDQAILASADAMIGKARDAMATQQLHQVLNAVWTAVADANRYFAGEAPWALAKTDPARQGTVLYVTAEVLRQIAILAQPFMPELAGKLLDLLAVPDGERTFAFLGSKHRIAPGAKLPAPAAVFPRYVEPESGNASRKIDKRETPVKAIAPVTVTEQLMYCTARIVGRNAANVEIKIGTGFFFQLPIAGGDNQVMPLLITNKHVIDGVAYAEFVIHTNSTGGPNPDGLQNVRSESNEWIHHPDAKVDLCALPVAGVLNQIKGFYRALEPSIIPTEAQLTELSAVEEILMVGYPNGLWDSINNYPLIRRGITASHPAVDFDVDGVAATVVDAACFPGSSGSPVILHNSGNYVNKQGTTVIGSRTILLGVLFKGPIMQANGKIVIRDIPTASEPVAQVNMMMNLGYIVKSKELTTLGEVAMKKFGHTAASQERK